MAGYVDLHSHWIAAVDDGAQSVDDGIELLTALQQVGFDFVVATPHMRTNMFDNDRAHLEQAYQRMLPHLSRARLGIEVALACEHYLDDRAFQRILNNEGLPYPGNHAVLVEFDGYSVPAMLRERFYALRSKGLRPVVAHPERYDAWLDADGLIDDLIDRGTVLLLDVASLVGHYGQRVQYAAEHMLDSGMFYAACSDAHDVFDVDAVAQGIERMMQLIGKEESRFLLQQGPRHILDGSVEL